MNPLASLLLAIVRCISVAAFFIFPAALDAALDHILNNPEHNINNTEY